MTKEGLLVSNINNSHCSRVIYFDILNILACFSVVVLHCNQMVHTWIPGKNWICGLVIEVAFYWAVPIFFMLSGATLMRYRDRYDTKTFLKKRAKRTLLPYIFWSIVWYVIVNLILHHEEFSLRNFINLFMQNQIEPVYWFFPPLFSVYLAFPVFSLICDRKDILKYTVGTSFIFSSLLPGIFPLLGLEWNGGINISACSGMLFFVLLGFLLSEWEPSKKQRYLIYLLGLFGLIFRFGYTFYFSEMLGYVDRTFFSYTLFPSVFLSTAVFVFIKQMNFESLKKYTKKISSLSACSFGVYLIHKPLLDHLILGLVGVPMTSVALRTIGPFFVYCACIAIVMLIRRIPIIKNTVG